MLKPILEDIRGQLTIIIENYGGKDLIQHLETHIVEKYKSNPFVFSLNIELDKIETYLTVVNRCGIYVKNKYGQDIDCKVLIGSYLQNHLQCNEHIACIYYESDNRLLLKLH